MNKKDLLKAATKENGRILAINTEGHLVDLPPGSVKIAYDDEKEETVFAGLKPGWRIATAADVERKEVEEQERRAKERAAAGGASSPPVNDSGTPSAA